MIYWLKHQNHRNFHHDTDRLYITGSILLEILGDRAGVTLGEVTVGVIVGNLRVSICSGKLAWSSILGSQNSKKEGQSASHIQGHRRHAYLSGGEVGEAPATPAVLARGLEASLGTSEAISFAMSALA